MQPVPHWCEGQFDEDDGTPLDPSQVRDGMDRELKFMDSLHVGDPVYPEKGEKVWSARWCLRRKEGAVRARYVVR